MYKRILFIAILITIVVKFSCAQIPGLTITTEKDREEIYLKSKTVWITLTPFFLVERKFSPDQGETWQNVGMFGGKIKPYVQNDSIARHNLNNYQLTRMFGLAQMWVISPLLAYKHLQQLRALFLQVIQESTTMLCLKKKPGI